MLLSRGGRQARWWVSTWQAPSVDLRTGRCWVSGDVARDRGLGDHGGRPIVEAQLGAGFDHRLDLGEKFERLGAIGLHAADAHILGAAAQELGRDRSEEHTSE